MPRLPDARLPATLFLLLVGLAPGVSALQVDARPVLGAPLAQADRERALRPAAAQLLGGPARGRGAQVGEDLAMVRALFVRLDADADGRLDRREADHGSIDALALVRSDGDRNGLLDFQEFCVARQRELSLRRQPVGPDLIAESTRIQARWRAQAAQDERGRATAVADRRLAAQRALPPQPAGSSPAAASPTGPAQRRLSDAIGSSAAQTAERARRAQILVELRRRRRGPD